MTSDVLIAGGGPIGLAAAIGCRMAGMSVTVMEPRSAPIEKACGEGLMPAAVGELDRLGVRPEGYSIQGIRYISRHGHTAHLFRGGPGLGVRRPRLHSALAARAQGLGVGRVAERVRSVRQDGDGVTVNDLRARWLLGCDGLHSRVRDLVGLPARPPRHRRFGLRRHFALPPWGGLVEVYWTRTAEIYVTPVAEDEVGIAVLGPGGTDYEDAVLSVPALRARLAGAAPTTAIRGAGPLRQDVHRVRNGRVLLVGDASGYTDALTGEGIRVGLAQARAAVHCLASGDAGDYQRLWHRATDGERRITAGLVAVAGTPLRPLIVPAAARAPLLYCSIVDRLAG